jgi:Zn-dependent protease
MKPESGASLWLRRDGAPAGKRRIPSLFQTQHFRGADDMEGFIQFLNSILYYDLQSLPFIVISLLIAFTVHEFSHAYFAYKFGDPTAKNQGRLTLNPISHLDPIGTVVLLIAGFGWARPVPVNRFYFKNPRLAGVVVSAAGPLSNLLLAFIGGACLFLLFSAFSGSVWVPYAAQFFNVFIQLNLILFVFNLLPLPPLDGYRIVEDLVPAHVRVRMAALEAYGLIIFLVLIFVDPLYHLTIGPLFQYVVPALYHFIIGIFLGVFA